MAQKKQSRLSTKPQSKSSDAWVKSRNGVEADSIKPSVKVKRITFEVTEEEHQAIKICAAKRGMTIKEFMLSLTRRELENSTHKIVL